MGKKWWFFGSAAIGLLVIFLLAGFPPGEDELLLRYAGWSKYSAVTVPANFARELPFPIPTAILSLVTRQIPTNIFLFRFPNLIFGLAWLAVMTTLAPAGFGILAVTCLGVVWTMISDFPATITLFLVTAVISVEIKYRDEKKKIIWLGFLSLWLSLTSFSGWIFTAVFAGMKLLKKDLRAGLILLAVVIYAWFAASGLYWRLNGPEIALLKQGDAIFAGNLWGSRSLPWIYFWHIPLVFIAFYFWKNISVELKFVIKMLGVWGILCVIAGNTGDWLANSMGFIVASLLMISWLMTGIKLRGKMIIILLLLASTIPSFYHFLYHEEVWRDNRPPVHLTMAQMTTKYQAGYVTTVLGRSFLYYGWREKISPKEFWQGAEAGMKINGIKFDHFEKPVTKGVYVGLPGEFLQNRAIDNKNEFRASELPNGWELLESVKIEDTVSFGNGYYIWAVRIN